jgi:hypothetical protein
MQRVEEFELISDGHESGAKEAQSSDYEYIHRYDAIPA